MTPETWSSLPLLVVIASHHPTHLHVGLMYATCFHYSSHWIFMLKFIVSRMKMDGTTSCHLSLYLCCSCFKAARHIPKASVLFDHCELQCKTNTLLFYWLALDNSLNVRIHIESICEDMIVWTWSTSPILVIIGSSSCDSLSCWIYCILHIFLALNVQVKVYSILHEHVGKAPDVAGCYLCSHCHLTQGHIPSTFLVPWILVGIALLQTINSY